MIDVMTALTIGLGIAGRMIVEAIEGNIFVEEDGVEADDLFLAQVDQSFLEGFQLMDGALGRLRLMGRGGWQVGGAGLCPRGNGYGGYIG